MSSGAPAIAIIDYGIGNLRSVEKAFQRIGADARLSTDPAEIERAAAVVLPGVGAMARCMEALAGSGLEAVTRSRLAEALDGGRHALGICVGMQMLHAGSDEHGGVAGLDCFDARVVRLPEGERVPQMQWNVVTPTRAGTILDHCPSPLWAYFVHSFAPVVHDAVIGVCTYGTEIGAVVGRAHLLGTQFHPEKSGAHGLALIERFCAAVGGPSLPADASIAAAAALP